MRSAFSLAKRLRMHVLIEAQHGLTKNLRV
ncbi:MAG: hypothetical protein ACJAVI_006279 [Candidatus Azotimanducaceae bacterium]|jgi:hypothetical protein